MNPRVLGDRAAPDPRKRPASRRTTPTRAATDAPSTSDERGASGHDAAADEVARSLRRLTGLEVDPAAPTEAIRSATDRVDPGADADLAAALDPVALLALDDANRRGGRGRRGGRPARTRGGKPVAPRASTLVTWGMPVVLVLLGLFVANLAFDAKDLVMNSRDGAIARNITDPTAPGFSAEVVPTATLLVLHTDDANGLVGVALMSLVSAEGGGTVALFNEDLIVKDPSGASSSLGQRYASGGPDAVKRAVTRLVGADVDAAMNVGATVLEELIRPVAPLQYALRENVRAVQNGATVTLLRSGTVSIESVEQVRAATEVLGPGEATVNRVARQAAFWDAWFAALRAVPDKASVLPVYDAPIVRFAKSLGTGQARVVQAPFEQVTFGGEILHLADVEATRALASQMIPYPEGYEPGARLLVELRNGTGVLSSNEPLIRDIVAADGQLVLLGNTEAFGVVASSVTFYDDALRPRIETFARAIGITNVVFAERPGSSIEATVTIGADYSP